MVPTCGQLFARIAKICCASGAVRDFLTDIADEETAETTTRAVDLGQERQFNVAVPPKNDCCSVTSLPLETEVDDTVMA